MDLSCSSPGVPRYTGGPNKLLIGSRLEVAKALLALGWKTRDVATSLGYAHTRGFSAAFSRLTGEAPGTFAARRLALRGELPRRHGSPKRRVAC